MVANTSKEKESVEGSNRGKRGWDTEEKQDVQI
jgi:hypothetical protein